MAFAPGTRLGPYEIISKLGEGGMGAVYRARDTRLQREVAIKVLPDAVAGEPETLTRFEREAQTASNLNHPNILTIFEVGEAGGTRFIATELVEGETLRARLKRGPLPVDDALEIAGQMASGVAAAHEAGIVHRDLKPDNVMIRPDGLVKVLDFGLAKSVARSPVPSDSETELQTSAGTIVGTTAYMSPEQARGLDVDARSDVFSLGAVIYEMLAGQSPFSGQTRTDMLVSILERPHAPVSSRRRETPVQLDGLVNRCLEKDAGRRFGSARELFERLSDVKAHPDTPTDDTPSIAVLPFVNMSADPDNEFFCDGIAEELTTALAKIDRLRVAGRKSAFAFKGKDADEREIGRALNVDSVLEGSVRKAGKRLRIRAELVSATNGYQLWSERYDREMEDLFDIQDEIALAIVEALRVTLLGDERSALLKRATNNVEAFGLCVRARHIWHQWTDESFAKAIDWFGQAIAIDPDYAPAHFGLADCYTALEFIGRLPMEQRPLMRQGLDTALRLDPELADAHAVRAIVQGLYEWDWPAALESCRTAHRLNPRSAHATTVLGEILLSIGRTTEAVEMTRRAVALDPLALLWNANVAQAYLGARDYEAARGHVRITLDIAPDYWFAHLFDGLALGALGRWNDAVVACERAVKASGNLAYAVAHWGWALARAGQSEEARDKLRQLQHRARDERIPALCEACIHAGLGETDEAFGALERAWRDHDSWLSYLLTSYPTLDGLRPDPRFDDLVRRIGLGQSFDTSGVLSPGS